MKRLFLSLVIIVFSFNISFAAMVSLVWAPPEGNPQPTGYKVYYGTVTGTYTSSVDVSTAQFAQIIGLTQGVTYYFIVVGYNAAGDGTPTPEMSTVANDPVNEVLAQQFSTIYP